MFSCEFWEIFQNTFLQNTYGRLLLKECILNFFVSPITKGIYQNLERVPLICKWSIFVNDQRSDSSRILTVALVLLLGGILKWFCMKTDFVKLTIYIYLYLLFSTFLFFFFFFFNVLCSFICKFFNEYMTLMGIG